ncbi:MAG: hypothetical protein ACHQ9S_17615 [Candidatus Binatia bacterium]
MASVAHVSFAGGGIFLPDHGPGDRLTLIDYVARLVRSKPKVQILLEHQRWLAQSGNHVCCACCGYASNVSCREASNDTDAFCLECALSRHSARRKNAATALAPQHLTLASARA